MNIFFTGAVRGGRSYQPEYAAIVEQLKNYGKVFSTHVSEDSLSQYGETNLAPDEIASREIQALTNADMVVAEVTTPSLGVGYLVKSATAQGKKVLALYKGKNALQLSAIIKGDRSVELYTYITRGDLEKIFANLGK